MENNLLTKLNDDEKFALFYGIMLGDGCLSHYKSKYGSIGYAISITCNYYDDQEFFKEIVLPLTISLRGKNINIKQRPKKGTIELNFCDKILFNKINSFGFPIGKKGKDLIIPEKFYKDNLNEFEPKLVLLLPTWEEIVRRNKIRERRLTDEELEMVYKQQVDLKIFDEKIDNTNLSPEEVANKLSQYFNE